MYIKKNISCKNAQKRALKYRKKGNIEMQIILEHKVASFSINRLL